MKSIFFTIVLCIFSFQMSTAQWVQVSNGMGNIMVQSLASGGNYIFAGSAYENLGIFLTTNNGTNWTQTALNNQWVLSLAVSGNFVFAGTYTSGVYLSTDNGANWSQTSLNNREVLSLAANGNYVYAGTSFYGVYISTNNGTSWSQFSLSNNFVYSLAANGNDVFAGTYYAGIFKSTDNGITWTQTALNNQWVSSIITSGNNIFAGTRNYPNGNGVYLSTNNGTSWTQTSLNYRYVNSVAVNGNNIFAGTDIYGIYVSSDNGSTWTQRNEGLGNLTVPAFCILNNYIFACTYGGVYRRPLDELTGIKPVSNELPNQFSLSQNYPNPFNPKTVISFQLTVNSYARLVIYDILGKEEETLVNEQLKAGTYEINFDGSKLPSGVYYYQLTVSSEQLTVYKETKKMVLVK